MNNSNELINNHMMFFTFMKEKYNVYNNSNIFLRDIQYAVKSYFEKKETKLKFPAVTLITNEFIADLEKKDLLKKISNNSWKLNFSFEKPVSNIVTE